MVERHLILFTRALSLLSLPSKPSLSEWEGELVLRGAGQVKGGFSLVPAPRWLFRWGAKVRCEEREADAEVGSRESGYCSFWGAVGQSCS